MQNDGGPAFPNTEVWSHDGQGLWQGAQGMTLRDYFAAKFAASMTTAVSGDGDFINPDHIGPGGMSVADRVAAIAYKLADAMLAARLPQKESS